MCDASIFEKYLQVFETVSRIEHLGRGFYMRPVRDAAAPLLDHYKRLRCSAKIRRILFKINMFAGPSPKWYGNGRHQLYSICYSEHTPFPGGTIWMFYPSRRNLSAKIGQDTINLWIFCLQTSLLKVHISQEARSYSQLW